MVDAGIPDGVFNMIQGYGDAGAAIVDHDDVATVLFTGSAEVGHHIADQVGGTPGKLAACEMGGKNAVVITDEADLDLAVPAAVLSGFKTTGQRCVSASISGPMNVSSPSELRSVIRSTKTRSWDH